MNNTDVRTVFINTYMYMLIAFPLSFFWHNIIFERQYIVFGYFDKEPDLILGLASIIAQGTVLSILFPLTNLSGNSLIRALKFAAITGLFFWISHVLTYVANNGVNYAPLFTSLETVFVSLQFGLFGLVTGILYHTRDIQNNTHKESFADRYLDIEFCIEPR